MSNNFNIYNNDIEKLLQQEAEQYTVYPSDKVWTNIRTELHEEKRWPALIFMFVGLIITLTTATVIYYPPKKDYTDIVKLTNTNNYTINKHKNIVNSSIIINNTTTQDIAFVAPHTLQFKQTVLAKSAFKNTISKKDNNIVLHNVTNNKPVKINNNVVNDIASNKSNKNMAVSSINTSLLNNNSKTLATIIANNKEEKAVKNAVVFKKSVSKKWQLQFYFTPSVSYRELEDDKTRDNMPNVVVNIDVANKTVNDVVHDKPLFGGELGIAVMYPITKNFFIKSGLQFNIRKYAIKATKQLGSATINYVNNNQLNSVTYSSVYSTAKGNNEVLLDNSIYQLSMPLGLQWNFVNGERWGLSAGASIQPTVTLNKNVYAISTDYKAYTDGTPFFRKWNINSSAELLLTLKSGKNKWFFGPQIRRQQLSTYNDMYPIKEYRVDYGFKIGFTKEF